MVRYTASPFQRETVHRDAAVRSVRKRQRLGFVKMSDRQMKLAIVIRLGRDERVEIGVSSGYQACRIVRIRPRSVLRESRARRPELRGPPARSGNPRLRAHARQALL